MTETDIPEMLASVAGAPRKLEIDFPEVIAVVKAKL